MRTLQCHSIVWLSACGVAWASPRAAMGHALLVSRGEATIHLAHVTFEIEINAEDFLHAPQLRPDSQGSYSAESLMDSILRKAENLSETIVLRDGRGRRLSASPYALQSPLDFASERLTLQDMRRIRILYRAEYRVSTPTHHLSFQVVPQQGAMAAAWQLACAVRGASQSDARTLRLTSRGNVETVEVIQTSKGVAVATKSANAAGDCNGRLGEELCADIGIQEDGIRARIEIPLPLLSTWVTLPTTDGEYLTPLERKQTLDKLSELWRNPLTVHMASKELLPQSVTFTWLPLDMETDGSTELGGDVSVWNGRLRVDLLFPTNDFSNNLELRWNLFNNAVLTAHAFLRSGQTVTEHEFSTYAADFHWLLER